MCDGSAGINHQKCEVLFISNLRKEGTIRVHRLRVQSIFVGKAWQQELEANSYIVSSVKK